MVGKEAVQEVPMLIASGGVGRIVSGIAGKAIGFWAATGTDSVLNAGESFSANFGETYDNIKRAGGSDEYAKSQAYKSGAQAAVVGFGSNLIADSALVKAFMGEATKITAGTFTKLAGKQYVTEWGEEFLQNASVQYNSFGQVDWNQAQTAGAIGGAIGMGVASGIMSASAINYNMQVAVDSIGRPVTLQQFIDGSVQVQPGSFNAQAPIFDIKGVTVSLDNFNKVTTAALEQSDFSFDAYATNLKSLSDQGVPAGSVSDASLEVISATPEQARTIIKNYVDLGLTANTPTTTGGPTAGTTPPAVTPPAVTPPAVTPPTAAPPAPTPAPPAPTPAPPAPTPAPLAPTPAPPAPTPAPPAPTPAPLAPTPAPPAPTPAPPAPTPAPPAPTPAPPVPTPAPPAPTPAPPAATPAPPAPTPAPPAPTPAPPAPTPAPPAPTPASPATTDVNASLESRLSQAIQDARTAGLQGDAALQTAINSVASNLGTTRDNLLSQLGTTEAALRTEFSTQLGGVTAELGNVESRLTAAIDAAKAAGLQGDAALQAAIDSVSSELGTTKQDLLGQIGKTEEQLRTDFSTQLGAVTAEIGNVETRLQDAIAAAEARGLTRDQAIESALDTVATDLGTTKSDLLTQIGTTESTLRGEIEASQAALGQQITSTEQRLNEAIAAAESRGLTRDQAIQAGLDQVATDLGTTKSDILSQLGSTASDLRAEIEASQTALGQQITTGLEGLGTALSNAETRINEKAAEYERNGISRDQALSKAIGDVATELGTTAQNLSNQISQTKTDLSTQITGTQTALQKQIDEASQLLGKPAQAVTQADLDYVNSVIRGDVTTTPDLTYDVNRDGKIDQSDYDFLNRATTGSGEPPEFAPGSRWAPTGLFGDIADLKTDLTGQFQQMEQKRLADAAKAKAEQEAKQRRQTGLEMLKPAAGPAKTETETKLSPLQTSGQSKYLGPLAAFFSQVEKGDFTPTTQQQTTMAPQQQTQPDRYAYGQEPSIDDLLDPYGENKPQEQQSPFGFKAGGLATPMFAAGGGTRYGQYAKGGLNVVHHSGKARIDFRRGAAVTGPGDGQSDDIPAMLADGEFVFPADVVAALGNGSTKAGSDKLYDMMHSIRAHARSSGPKDLPPPAKSPLEYLEKTSKPKSARG
jgi:archaellum component FlaC